MRWQDMRTVVTGGASGIGLALAQRAGAHGATVAIVDITVDRAREAAAGIAGARGYGCDVSDADSMMSLAATIAADLGGVDAVFANAGVGLGGKIEDLSFQDVQWIASVNIFGPVNTARAFVSLLLASTEQGRPAQFVITGSEHSLGIPTIGASNMYTMSKHAALGLADVLRSDLEGSGVHVALLCPGLVGTNLFDARSQRGAQFGGPFALPAEAFDRAQASMASKGQDADLTAQLCFEGLERGDFLIVADPQVGVFARRRLEEIEKAVALIERRLPLA